MYRCLILLSTYNGEKYLPELLESVLAQKDIYVDILARDDGSCLLYTSDAADD